MPASHQDEVQRFMRSAQAAGVGCREEQPFIARLCDEFGSELVGKSNRESPLEQRSGRWGARW